MYFKCIINLMTSYLDRGVYTLQFLGNVKEKSN